MFTPKIAIQNINTLATQWTIAEVTGAWPTDPTGYNQPLNTPPYNQAWTKSLYHQMYGSTEVEKIIYTPATAVNANSVVTTFALQDGIHLFTEYFLMPYSGTFTVSGNTMTLTGAGVGTIVNGWMSGAYGLITTTTPQSIDPTAINVIKGLEVSGPDTILLTSTPPANSTNLYTVYKAQKFVLITNEAGNDLVKQIGEMSLTEALDGISCDIPTAKAIMGKLLLKTAATVAFNCGNYQKAAQATALLSKNISSTPNCSSC